MVPAMATAMVAAAIISGATVTMAAMAIMAEEATATTGAKRGTMYAKAVLYIEQPFVLFAVV